MTATADRARAIVNALADLAPSSEPPRSGRVVPLEWFQWLPAAPYELFAPSGIDYEPSVAIGLPLAERLAAIEQVRKTERPLRIGWMFVAGRVRGERVFQPLLTVPVRVDREAGGGQLRPAGDAEITALVRDAEERRRLEESLEHRDGRLLAIAERAERAEWSTWLGPRKLRAAPGLRAFALDAARAAGFDVETFGTAGSAPESYFDGPLAILPGAAAYVARDTATTSRAASLREWAAHMGGTPTALHSMYLGISSRARDVSGTPGSPFLLTVAQRRAVAASRKADVSVVSGAPGTGKSQTVLAIACDALARGESVLLATRSDAAVDALLDLLDRVPGPEPVVFGSNERRVALARRLETGISPVSAEDVASMASMAQRAAAHADEVRRSLTWLARTRALGAGDPAENALRDSAPALFRPGADLDEVERLLARAAGTGWRARRARRRLAGISDAPLPVLAEALYLARHAAATAAEDAGGPLGATPDYAALVAAEDALRTAVGRWLETEARSASRIDAAARASVAALATSLRSGRAARRAQLARIDTPLTRALPLWVGSLPDIDDLLPQVPALFDLVVLDEASSIEQSLAAPALLRARRAVVVGDPRQLRHVSFLDDVYQSEALVNNGLDAMPLVAAKLDVRRNSAFDVAAGAGEVVTLDEHHRSRPHLVDYVARKVYGGELSVAHRTPENELLDCIAVERVTGRRAKDGHVPAEVQRVVALLRERAATATSVGVVTPLRAQADALEAAVLAEFGADELEAMDLRVGTVHAFQGNERDDVIVSLGIPPRAAAATWRFADDSHLFAVLVTRARERTTVVHSGTPPKGGLVAGYLAQADAPPGRSRDRRVSERAAAIARDLRAAGFEVVTGFPAGRHSVDVAVCASPPVAVVCDLHPDGVDAHVERAVALSRNGWRVVEALPRPVPATVGEVTVALVTGVLATPSARP